MRAETELGQTQASMPMLSICIPTFNRAHFLEDALISLRPEVALLGRAVEVVVCDNGSSDNTSEILQRNKDWVRWERNEKTVSFAENVLRVTCDVAKGRFVWLVGDDDLVIRGAVTRVLRSLRAHPEIAYHYLNFGWMEMSRRKEIIHQFDSTPPASPFRPGKWQCDETETLILPRIEDLAFVPGGNPSALFSCMMCFAAHRELFVAARAYLRPCEFFDGSSNALDDIFPHPMITLPPMAGKPVVYVGDPCLLQGLGGQDWHTTLYACKNMVLGTYQLFCWLESNTTFAKDAMTRLWESFYDMAGRLFFRMLNSPMENAGLDVVLAEVIPNICSQPTFSQAIQTEARSTVERDEDARVLARLVEPLLRLAPESKVGLWGVQGRGGRLVQISEPLRERLVWVGDVNPDLQGTLLKGTELEIVSPESLCDADLDILVVATSPGVVPEVIFRAALLIDSGIVTVSLKGLDAVGPKIPRA